MKTQPGAINLPQNCFISHSYQDAEARKRLLKLLPAQVRPIIFPPIMVSPEQLVSNELVQTILRCDGLIYLQGGASEESFWVAFERDYALRAGKEVFAFDPATGELRQDRSAPLHLPIFASYSRKDEHHVRQIVDYMKTERYFDIWSDLEELTGGTDWQNALEKGLLGQLEAGGYVVVFWSEASSHSVYVQMEWELAFSKYPRQVLPVLLDRTRLSLPLATIQALQLYGDQQRSAVNRLDDLVVCLYWWIYRTTRQNRLE